MKPTPEQVAEKYETHYDPKGDPHWVTREAATGQYVAYHYIQEAADRLTAKLNALEAAERAYGLLEEAHKSTTEKFADMMARVRELECVRDALIRSEESANQLEEMVSNQAREYLERAEAAEGKLEAAEQDSARLDWLWANWSIRNRIDGGVHYWHKLMRCDETGGTNLREAIDAEMGAAARKAQP